MTQMESFKKDVVSIVERHFNVFESEIDSILDWQKVKAAEQEAKKYQMQNKLIDLFTALKIAVSTKNQNNIEYIFEQIERVLV